MSTVLIFRFTCRKVNGIGEVVPEYNAHNDDDNGLEGDGFY